MDLIGSMNESITIQTPTTVTGTAGGETYTYATFYTCWAERDYKGGKEGTEGKEFVATNKVVFRVYWKAGVTEVMRIKDAANKLYDIQHIAIEGLNKYLLITALLKDNV